MRQVAGPGVPSLHRPRYNVALTRAYIQMGSMTEMSGLVVGSWGRYTPEPQLVP